MAGFVGAEKTAVLFQCCSAPGRIDDDRRVSREERDGVTGSGDGTIVPPAVGVERATTVTSGRDAISKAECVHDFGHRSVHRAMPHIHDAAGEDPDVGFARCRLQAGAKTFRNRTETTGHEPRETECDQQSGGNRQKTWMGESPQAEPQPQGCRLLRTSESVRGVDQLAIGNAARAGRFTTPALDAGVERFHHVVVEAEAIVVDRSHDLDTSTRRFALVTRHPKGRTMR